jgi:hypothetical protein
MESNSGYDSTCMRPRPARHLLQCTTTSRRYHFLPVSSGGIHLHGPRLRPPKRYDDFLFEVLHFFFHISKRPYTTHLELFLHIQRAGPGDIQYPGVGIAETRCVCSTGNSFTFLYLYLVSVLRPTFLSIYLLSRCAKRHDNGSHDMSSSTLAWQRDVRCRTHLQTDLLPLLRGEGAIRLLGHFESIDQAQ